MHNKIFIFSRDFLAICKRWSRQISLVFLRCLAFSSFLTIFLNNLYSSCLFLFLTILLALSLSIHLFLSFLISLCLSLSIHLSLFFSLSLSLFLSIFLSIFLSLLLSFSLTLSISLSLLFSNSLVSQLFRLFLIYLSIFSLQFNSLI